MYSRNAFAVVAALTTLQLGSTTLSAAEGYRSFNAAIYARAYEVQKMADLDWLRTRFDVMAKHVRVTKMYLETHRDKVLVDSETLQKAKGFFAERGIATAAGSRSPSTNATASRPSATATHSSDAGCARSSSIPRGTSTRSSSMISSSQAASPRVRSAREASGAGRLIGWPCWTM